MENNQNEKYLEFSLYTIFNKVFVVFFSPAEQLMCFRSMVLEDKIVRKSNCRYFLRNKMKFRIPSS